MSYLDFVKKVAKFADVVNKVAGIGFAGGTLDETKNADVQASLPEDVSTKLVGEKTEDEAWMKDKGALIYPQNLFQPGQQAYIFFLMRDSNLRSTAVYKRIGLYMPPAIKVSYGSNWEEINMQVSQAIDMGKDAIGAAGSAFGGTSAEKQGAAQFATDAALTGGAGIADALTGSDAFGNFNEVERRRTTNPHQALLFKGVSFREFQFSFELLARSQKESDSIRQIIKTFKWGMHPGGENNASFWSYPNTFDVYLLTPSHRYMFNISQCVLTAMDVDYGASGAASFFKGSGAPVHINLNLTFKELSVLTKKLIESDY